jgi:hypothetical protein
MCGTYDASLLNEFFDSIMVEVHGWMYGGWKKGGAHMRGMDEQDSGIYRQTIVV